MIANSNFRFSINNPILKLPRSHKKAESKALAFECEKWGFVLVRGD
ncbi:hypothetical protein L8106_06824 [Lyngbya sp. PCC 8106]|nr:hypothetical protein L8106_06824 [Lyngbya sp. PCC 8106]